MSRKLQRISASDLNLCYKGYSKLIPIECREDDQVCVLRVWASHTIRSVCKTLAARHENNSRCSDNGYIYVVIPGKNKKFYKRLDETAKLIELVSVEGGAALQFIYTSTLLPDDETTEKHADNIPDLHSPNTSHHYVRSSLDLADCRLVNVFTESNDTEMTELRVFKKGFLEKASKTNSEWRLREVVLTYEGLWYSKGAQMQRDDDGLPKWVCISIRECYLVENDTERPEVFTCFTRQRVYKWKAPSAADAMSWTTAIQDEIDRTQEKDILFIAETKIQQDEFYRTKAAVIVHASKLNTGIQYIIYSQMETIRNLNTLNGVLQNAEATSLLLTLLHDDWQKNLPLIENIEFTQAEVVRHIQTFNIKSELSEPQSQKIHSWLENVFFDHVIATPIYSRRIAQIAALGSK